MYNVENLCASVRCACEKHKHAYEFFLIIGLAKIFLKTFVFYIIKKVGFLFIDGSID
jgi:hypothetical protein